MSTKQCNHCQDVHGQGKELNVAEVVSCTNCDCFWDHNGQHLLAGINCDFPQPQNWGDTPIVKMQQIDSIK